MRLARLEVEGRARIGLLRDGSGVGLLDPERYPTMASALAGLPGLEREAVDGTRPQDDMRLLAPIDPDTRVFCVAQNYRAHAHEVSGTDAPPAPVIFLKPASALVGPDEDIELSPVTSFLDYEAELAVVVGRAARRLSAADAAGVVVAATCLNDGSARDLQPAELGGKPAIDWFSGKSLDRSGAVGPWLSVVDGAAAVADRRISCRVNGELVQDDRTSSMVHDIPRLVAFVSSRVGLRPGDVIATGTPGGVGAARGSALRDGDRVEVDIDGLGRLANTVRSVGA